MDAIAVIRSRVEDALLRMPAHHAAWARDHLLDPPRTIELFTDWEGDEMIVVWLVTDDTGKNDGSCRVVYDSESDMFGHAITMAGGREWFEALHSHDFGETVDSI